VHFVSSEEGKAIMRSVGTVPYEDAVGLWLTYLDQQKRLWPTVFMLLNLLTTRPEQVCKEVITASPVLFL